MNDGELDFFPEVQVQHDANQEPRGRYEDPMDKPLQFARRPRSRREAEEAKNNTEPVIEGIVPTGGSPEGNVLITVFGQNLKSKKLDIAGHVSESEDQGEDFQIWFEAGEYKVPCQVDRMLTLHGQPLAGKDFIICKSLPMPRWQQYNMMMTIDGGPELFCGKFDFIAGNAPSSDYFYPGASAPAVAKGQWDYDGEFWTEWFNVDTPADDGVEHESYVVHWMRNRKSFENCEAPIGIEAYDLENLRIFVPSASQNADGNPEPDFITPIKGFSCTNSLQTMNPETGNVTVHCPDVKVRYRCLPGIVKMKGKIYTDVHGRSDDPDFHVNRIHESPKVVSDQDGWKAEAVIHLNDGQNCGSHPNCGQNERLFVKKIAGNDGLIHFKAKAAIPGAYNFTYETTHQGKSVVMPHWNSYLSDESLYPANFEVHPEIVSVYPKMGALTGGTLITIKGSGFIDDGLKRGNSGVSVAVGDKDCEIISMTETEIICKNQGGVESEESFIEQRKKQFVNTDGLASHSYRMYSYNYPERDQKIISAEQCFDICAEDFRCLAWNFIDSLDRDDWNGCFLYNYQGDNAAHEAEFRATYWYPLNAYSGKLRLSFLSVHGFAWPLTHGKKLL